MKQMKNLSKYFAGILLIGAGIFTSCDKYLDIPQQGVQPVDGFYQTDAEAMNALADLYTQWRSTYSGMVGTLDNLADDSYAGWANMGDNSGAAHSFNTFTFDATRTTTLYRNPAGLIMRANMILSRVAPDTPVKKRIHAECYVIRAWTYSYMCQLWGGVPLFDEEITVGNAAGGRATEAEVWAVVNKDFETAIASGDLPSKSSVGDKDNILRVTKEAAQAWYGKALLWQEKWAEAATQLKAVINSGKYQLVGDNELLNHLGVPDFGYIVRASNSLNTENIFEFNSKKDQNGNAGGGAYGGLGSSWRGDQLNHNGSAFRYIPELDQLGNGWGGTAVTRKSLVDEFELVEGPNSFRHKGSVLDWEGMKALGMGITGVYYSTEGYWDLKYRSPRAEAGSWALGGVQEINVTFNTWKPMRYAELLLNAAEACIRSGDAASALIYTNLVHERARLAPLTSITITDIKREKRLELYREGCRYIDLVRWEKLNDPDGITASKLLGEQGHYVPAFDGISVNYQAYTLTEYGWKKGKHELLPFPEVELNANPNIVQNPGW
jgi:hypothetical protein